MKRCQNGHVPGCNPGYEGSNPSRFSNYSPEDLPVFAGPSRLIP